MLTSFLIYFVVLLIDAVKLILDAITFVIPQQIPNAFNLIFSYARLGDGIFPISDALLAISTVLMVWVLIYVIKILLFAWSLIPIIGKTVNLPQHTTTTISQESIDDIGYYHQSNKVIHSRQKKRWM